MEELSFACGKGVSSLQFFLLGKGLLDIARLKRVRNAFEHAELCSQHLH